MTIDCLGLLFSGTQAVVRVSVTVCQTMMRAYSVAAYFDQELEYISPKTWGHDEAFVVCEEVQTPRDVCLGNLRSALWCISDNDCREANETGDVLYREPLVERQSIKYHV